jgi:ribosomal 50S subunit-recycling heat shock protein
MRLDLFLKTSRLVTRRTLAQELCDAGLVEINGMTAKSGKEVRVGDLIRINRRDRSTEVKVALVPSTKQVSKAAAGGLYQLIEDKIIPAGDVSA